MMYTDWQMLMQFRDFAHISINFSGIFNKSKYLGMRLHPLPPTPVELVLLETEISP